MMFLFPFFDHLVDNGDVDVALNVLSRSFHGHTRSGFAQIFTHRS
jgi:hypothetical protein